MRDASRWSFGRPAAPDEKSQRSLVGPGASGDHALPAMTSVESTGATQMALNVLVAHVDEDRAQAQDSSPDPVRDLMVGLGDAIDAWVMRNGLQGVPRAIVLDQAILALNQMRPVAQIRDSSDVRA